MAWRLRRRGGRGRRSRGHAGGRRQRSFDEVEDDLAADYSRFRGNDMTWDEARLASRAAWDRVDRRIQDAR